MVLIIPPEDRLAPQWVTHVDPIYPAELLGRHVHGDVAMDVTLNEDGSVKQVELLEGDAVLAKAAINAVKQWKYKPSPGSGIPLNKFVVVVTFDKDGKVH